MSEATESSERPREFKWGFASAALVILVLMIVGQFVGTLVERLTMHAGAWAGREWLLVAVIGGFSVSTIAFLFLQRAAVFKFFRSMHVGVALVSWSLVAVAAGVLVPQIDNFEDATERVPSVSDIDDEVFYALLPLPAPDDEMLDEQQRISVAAQTDRVLAGLTADQKTRIQRYKSQYLTFRWAEGYFLYHLKHPYGWGMPKPGGLTAEQKVGLERFGNKYGQEERTNREKQMKAAFGGRAISQEIGSFIRRNETRFRAAFDVCTTMHLNRTYKSHWFATLLGLLFVGIFSNTFKGAPSSWLSTRKVGYVTVHIGVMTLLLGGAISKANTVRGILNLDLRQGPTDKFLAYFDRNKPRWMPFSIKLDRFARRDWKTLEVGFLDEQFKSNPPQYTLWPGRTVDLDFVESKDGDKRPRIRLEVVSVHERARVGTGGFEEAPIDERGMTLGPQVTLAVTPGRPGEDAPGASRRWQLSPLIAQRRLLYDPDVPFRMLAVFDQDPAVVRAALTGVDEQRMGWLSMRTTGTNEVEARPVAVKVGDVIDAPGGYKIRVARCVPAFQLDHESNKEIVDERPIGLVYPANPAAMLEITPPDGGTVEYRPVLERIDYEDAELRKELRFKDLVVNFTWDRWSAPGPERVVLSWDTKGRATLYASDGSATQADVKAPLTLPGGARVVLEDLFVNARPTRKVELDPAAPVIAGPHFDESFYATDPTGVEVRVTTDPGTPDEKSEVIVMASTEESFANQWLSPDRRFYLSYYHNDRAFPFEWRSVLSVWKKDASGRFTQVDAGSEEDREIRVNDYFHYGGYRFFQTNADARFPTYSGIGVVYDPGIPIVLAGMYLTILGTILAFIVRPISEAYGKRKKASVTA